MVTSIRMSKIQRDLMIRALKSEGGEVFADMITDHIVLATGNSPEDALRKEGAGMVLKFIRGLQNDTDNFIDHTTNQENEK